MIVTFYFLVQYAFDGFLSLVTASDFFLFFLTLSDLRKEAAVLILNSNDKVIPSF